MTGLDCFPQKNENLHIILNSHYFFNFGKKYLFSNFGVWFYLSNLGLKLFSSVFSSHVYVQAVLKDMFGAQDVV
jgi:hypothetical protein